jgi:hypothetical protein
MADVGMFRSILSFLRPNGIFYGHFVVIWYIFPSFGTITKESGNPELDPFSAAEFHLKLGCSFGRAE